MDHGGSGRIKLVLTLESRQKEDNKQTNKYFGTNKYFNINKYFNTNKYLLIHFNV